MLKLPYELVNIIFKYAFLLYDDLEISVEIRDFLLYFFENDLPVNYLKYVKDHLLRLFKKYKKPFTYVGED